MPMLLAGTVEGRYRIKEAENSIFFMFSWSFPTPDYSHVSKYKDVYEPAEDTFLMLDALEEESEFLQDLQPAVCVEVGSGSGVIITFLSSILGENSHYIATDINLKASLCTQETAQKNGITVSVINTNLVDGCRFSLHCQVDVLIFNPPYVVTSTEEVSSHGIAAAWAGGLYGREVMDKLFPALSDILSNKGVFYLLVIEENKPDEICELMSSYGMKTKIVLARKARNERLHVLKIQKHVKENLK